MRSARRRYSELSEQEYFCNEQTVHSFELLATLGQGGFATVLLARDRATSSLFALKTIAKRNVRSKQNWSMVLTESTALAELRHPLIISLFSSFQDAGHVYFLLELAEGGTLAQLRQHHSDPFDEPTARFYVAEIALALDHVHSRGFIYRDLKGDNVLISRDGHVKIADFGLATRAKNRPRSLAGTPHMIAPELLHPASRITQSIDWWALGLVVAELVLDEAPLSWVKGPEDLASLPHTFKKRLHLPDWSVPPASAISVPCRDVVEQLLEVTPSQRLCCTRGLAELQGAPWFCSVDWAGLERLQVEPPLAAEVRERVVQMYAAMPPSPEPPSATDAAATTTAARPPRQAELALLEQAAVASSGMRELRQLLVTGDVHVRDFDDRTLLHILCSGAGVDGTRSFGRARAMVRALRVVKMLVEEFGADINATDRWGSTPLQDAVRSDHTVLADYLRERGGALGSSPSTDLNSAAEAGDIDLMRRLVSNGVNVDSTDADSRRPLHAAAAAGRLEAVRFLVDNAHADHSPCDRWGNTPLGNAIFSGNDAVAHFLRSRGATAAVHAPAESADNVFNLLDGASRGSVEVMRRVLASGAVNVNETDFDSRSALHLAAEEGNLEAVRFLVEEAHHDLNLTDRWNNTPLDSCTRGKGRRGPHHAVVADYLRLRGAESACGEAVAGRALSPQVKLPGTTAFTRSALGSSSFAEDRLGSILYTKPVHVKLFPDPLVCPLEGQRFRCPMLASDGYTYEHSAIAAWISAHGAVSPITGDKLLDGALVPNRALGALIGRRDLRRRAALGLVVPSHAWTTPAVLLLFAALVLVGGAAVILEKATREADSSKTKRIEGLDLAFYYAD